MILILKVKITVRKRRISFEMMALIAILESRYLGERQKSRGARAW